MLTRSGNNSAPRQQIVPPALFGDAFGTRGDYSKGIFYAGRRKYLGDPEELEQNPLRPPLYFMSRTQRAKNSMRSNGIRLFQKLDFKKDEDPARNVKADIAQANRLTRARSIKQGRRSSITLKRFHGTNANDWRREFQAGCYFWVNRVTGEISADCPVEVLQDPSVIYEDARISTSEDDCMDFDDGTIENPELRQIFDLLDSSPSPAKRDDPGGRSAH